ncbi:M48 family metalloprotease [Hyphobacterium sp. CCMP332]|uniref:M48 family metalloprotease n=1 Tax=Hyphobacterium sp. CCMP332 TaxID=2749086 RepID=UPI00164F1B01|nr:M48 family metalloprotease [Hyphobacterium sp. CCMP332]QNL18584.1 M48 family metalloprotease [Hyphobacterium sp. CCMP332]
MRALIAFFAGIVSVFGFSGSATAQSLIRDTEIEIMLRDYTDPFLVAAGLEPSDVGLYIIADPAINAFVTGGQNIFMHTGTILEATDPLQIKGVLAHETGHIAGAHLARTGEAMNQAAIPMFATLGLGVLAAFAGEGGAAGALMASSQQFGALQFFTYTRTQESAADQAAIRFLEETGNSAEGLMEFFERFRYQEAFSPARRYPYFRTHPLSSARVAALREAVARSPYADQPESPEEIARLERLQAKIYGFMAEPGHVFYRYPESDQSLPARYARSVAYYHDARMAEAREEIESLIAEEPDNPFFYELYGQMLFESGHAAESIQYHQQSVDLMPQAPLLRINLAMSMIATDDDAYLEDAGQHLRVALDIEPDNSFAWYQLSIVHERNGDTARAQLAIAEQSYALGNSGRALQFAVRAAPQLERGTPDWYRANELIGVAQASAPAPGERRERRLGLNR